MFYIQKQLGWTSNQSYIWRWACFNLLPCLWTVDANLHHTVFPPVTYCRYLHKINNANSYFVSQRHKKNFLHSWKRYHLSFLVQKLHQPRHSTSYCMCWFSSQVSHRKLRFGGYIYIYFLTENGLCKELPCKHVSVVWGEFATLD